jgi:hypothetical protein
VLDNTPSEVRRIDATAAIAVDAAAEEARQAAADLGRRVAEQLRAAGADDMLTRMREQQEVAPPPLPDLD